MTSAKERAVEAGARSDAEFDGRSWEALSRAERERYLARARKSQGAAFPILAEELVAWHDEMAQESRLQAAETHRRGDQTRARHLISQSYRHEKDAVALRARIQQMAEAL